MATPPNGDLLVRAPVFAVENRIFMADEGPLVLDIDATVLPEDQWILEAVSFEGMIKNAPANDNWKFPVSGLFLIPPNTPTESDPDATFNLNLLSRPVPIPLSPDTAFRDFGGGAPLAGAIGMIGQSGFQMSVPGGWSIRAILVINPGNPGGNTGPGEESYGKLTAMVRIMRNLDVFQGD